MGAFSERQQGKIEELLWQERASHPEFNAFFDEDRNEPFFVESLENVQGDGRDTIIFRAFATPGGWTGGCA